MQHVAASTRRCSTPLRCSGWRLRCLPLTSPPASLGGLGVGPLRCCTAAAATRPTSLLGAGRRPAGVLAAPCCAVHNMCLVAACLAPTRIPGAVGAAWVITASALAVDQGEGVALCAARASRRHKHTFQAVGRAPEAGSSLRCEAIKLLTAGAGRRGSKARGTSLVLRRHVDALVHLA